MSSVLPLFSCSCLLAAAVGLAPPVVIPEVAPWVQVSALSSSGAALALSRFHGALPSAVSPVVHVPRWRRQPRFATVQRDKKNAEGELRDGLSSLSVADRPGVNSGALSLSAVSDRLQVPLGALLLAAFGGVLAAVKRWLQAPALKEFLKTELTTVDSVTNGRVWALEPYLPAMAVGGDSAAGLADIGRSGGSCDQAAAGGRGNGDMALEPWTMRIQTAIATSREIRGGNFVQIATVDSEGLPHCRTVVFRGFLSREVAGGGEVMQMITDARSEKVGHVHGSPACELVWWFSKSSEQYRVAGRLQLVGAGDAGALQEARQAMWRRLSDPAREQFYWPQPGVDFSGSPSVPTGGKDEGGQVLAPPETFLLVLLWPREVKYLRLSDNLAIRDVMDEAAGSWIPLRVNP